MNIKFIKSNKIEKYSINLTEKIQSILKSTETLSERNHAAEFNKLSLQEGFLHVIKITSDYLQLYQTIILKLNYHFTFSVSHRKNIAPMTAGSNSRKLCPLSQ